MPGFPSSPFDSAQHGKFGYPQVADWFLKIAEWFSEMLGAYYGIAEWFWQIAEWFSEMSGAYYGIAEWFWKIAEQFSEIRKSYCEKVFAYSENAELY